MSLTSTAGSPRFGAAGSSSAATARSQVAIFDRQRDVDERYGLRRVQSAARLRHPLRVDQPDELRDRHGSRHAVTPNVARFGLSWLKVYLECDTPFRQFLLVKPSDETDFETTLI